MRIVDRGWYGYDVEIRTLDRGQLAGKRQRGMAQVTAFDLVGPIVSGVQLGDAPEVDVEPDDGKSLPGERYRHGQYDISKANDRDIPPR